MSHSSDEDHKPISDSDEDSDGDELLCSKIVSKPDAGSSLTKTVLQNGAAKKDNQSKYTGSNKRPLDEEKASVQSSVKKSKVSDSSTPVNRKPVPLKAETSSDDDDDDNDCDDDDCDDDDADDVPNQKTKALTPSSSKSSSVNQKVVKNDSSALKQTNKKSKKIVKDSKDSNPSKVPPGSGEGKKWTSLVHNGVIFPPAYKPHGVKMLYKGKPVDLTPEQEEVNIICF